jgi:hypothetical protein
MLIIKKDASSPGSSARKITITNAQGQLMKKITAFALAAAGAICTFTVPTMALADTASPSATPRPTATMTVTPRPTATVTATPRATATATPQATGTITITATATPIIETRVECTTGAYGQQTCRTVEVRRVLGDQTPKGHEVKDAGVEDAVLFGAMALVGVSLGGLVISKRQ